MGLALGSKDGGALGLLLGFNEGKADEDIVGKTEGRVVGVGDGIFDGVDDGKLLGL